MKWKSRLLWLWIGMNVGSALVRTTDEMVKRKARKEERDEALLKGGQSFEDIAKATSARFHAHIAEATPAQRKAAHDILSQWQMGGRRKPPSAVLDDVLSALVTEG
jgi:hypothetical protein